MASITLPPSHDSFITRFVKSNILTKSQRPAPSTSFQGKTAIITGSNTGIGLACAKVMLNYHLTHLILAVRTVEKGERAAKDLRVAHPAAKIDVWELNMASYQSIKEFTQRCSTLPRLDIAILNAGGHPPMKYTTAPETGHEVCLQVNYLSTALLSILLLPMLKPKKEGDAPGRLSLANSGLALHSAFPEHTADPLLPSFDVGEGWGMSSIQERYMVTKTLLMMFILKLAGVVNPKDVIVNTPDPGFTKGTELQRDAPWFVGVLLTVLFARPLTARTPEQAAWTYIDGVSTKGAESHGSFLMDWKLWPFHKLMYTAEGRSATERLWQETVKELEAYGAGEVLKSIREKR